MTTRPPLDLRLYAVLDPSLVPGADAAALAEAAVAGGATVLQLRDKRADIRALVATARRVKAALDGGPAPLIVNDRVDVALAIEADGVHLGQDDLSAEDARRLMGPDALVGVSAGDAREAAEPDNGFADHAGLGCVFPSASKAVAEPPLGAHGLHRLVKDVRAGPLGAAPLCAIGGIDRDTAPLCLRAGVDGIAVIGALFGRGERAPRAVEAAARALRAIVDQALGERP